MIKVRTCAVCRTDLHIVDGELTRPKLPLILSHDVIGEVVSTGDGERADDVDDVEGEVRV